MSWDFCSVTEHIARKKYRCDAAEWILNSGYDEDDFNEDDHDDIERARAEGFMILPGTRYVKVSGMWDGEFSVFRARPELNIICQEYGLYEE